MDVTESRTLFKAGRVSRRCMCGDTALSPGGTAPIDQSEVASESPVQEAAA
jgi:hypothetical protein